MTQVGPFPDEKRLRAGLQELAKQLTYAAVVISGYANDSKPEVVAAKLRFFAASEKWQTKYMPRMKAAKDDNGQSIQPEKL